MQVGDSTMKSHHPGMRPPTLEKALDHWIAVLDSEEELILKRCARWSLIEQTGGLRNKKKMNSQLKGCHRLIHWKRWQIKGWQRLAELRTGARGTIKVFGNAADTVRYGWGAKKDLTVVYNETFKDKSLTRDVAIFTTDDSGNPVIHVERRHSK